jgi:WD40 repeat protein/DNA-binding SARP family transcriptional activator
MPYLSIRTLGPFQVLLDGEPVTGFDSDKVRALLAYLAVEADRPHRREKLAGLLWPDYPERSARTSLRSALANLRKVIRDQDAEPNFLLVDRQTIQFNPQSDHEIDAGKFSQLAGTGAEHSLDAEQLERTISLYSGDFMEAFSLPDSVIFEDWVLVTREALRRGALQALQHLTGYYQELEQYEKALRLALRQIEIEPFQETAHQQAMLIWAVSGRRNKALAHFENFRNTLETELGVVPLKQTREMYQQLLDGELPDPPTETIILRREPKSVGECPYRGLAAFREQDADFYHGRERFVQQLTDALKRRSLVGVILGSSGAGKSSVVHAGLIPRMRDEGKWSFIEFRPGGQPFQALANAVSIALEPGMSKADQLIEAHKLAEAFRTGDLSLSNVADRVLENDPKKRRLLLLVDQFEELYTLCPQPELRRRFIDMLIGAAQPAIPVVLLMTLRADFMGQALSHRPLADALQHGTFILGPMNREELQAAIQNPAEKQGAAFEPGLVNRILDDVGQEPGNLPLLEFALTLMWDQLDQGWLTHAAYEEIGRVEGALAHYAEKVYTGLDENEQEKARKIFIQLVQPGQGTEDTRRIATRLELGDDNWPLIQELADRRLVVTGRDEEEQETVELVHEAMISGWGRFRGWIDADRNFRVWQEGLRAAIRGWQASDRDDGALLRGAPLAQAGEWLEERHTDLGEMENNFIQASLELHQKEQARREKRRRLIVAGLAIGLMVAVLLSVFALVQRRSSLQNAAQAQNVALVAGSQAALANHDTDTAIALAWQAVRLNPDSALAQAQLSEVAYGTGTVRILEGNKDISAWIAMSPDDRTLLAGIDDGSVILWELATGQVLWEQQVQTQTGEPWVQDVAFSPDGGVVAATYDDRIMFWQAATGQLIRQIDSVVNRQKITFHPSGDQFATTGSEEQSRLVIWDFASGEVLREFEPGTYIEDLVYTADGSTILIASRSGLLTLIDEQTGDVIREFQNYLEPDSGWLRYITLSPDGTRVIAASYANFLPVWDFETGELLENYSYAGVPSSAFHPQNGTVLIGDISVLRTIDLQTGAVLRSNTGHNRGILGVAITSDGARAVTTGADETIRVWDLQGGQVVRRFTGPQASLGEISLSPDGRRMLVGSADGTTTLWDVEAGEEIRRFVDDQPITALRFSPDGRSALIGTSVLQGLVAEPGYLILWDVETGEEIRRFEGQPYAVEAVAFSPDGRLAASAGAGAMAILWDVETGAEIRRFEDYWVDSPWGIETFWDVEFSPDGNRIFASHTSQVFASHSNGAIIGWDVESGKRIQELFGHSQVAASIVFSKDGQRLVSGGTDSQIILWDMGTGNILRRFATHPGGTRQVQFSPDESFLLGGSLNGTNSLWRVDTGEEIRRYEGGFVKSMRFTLDGHHAVVGYQDGRVELWRIDSTLEELLTWTRNNRYIPELTCEQRQLYRVEPLCEPESN